MTSSYLPFLIRVGLEYKLIHKLEDLPHESFVCLRTNATQKDLELARLTSPEAMRSLPKERKSI